MKSITHFDFAVFSIGLLGLALMICGAVINTSPYRAEFSPYDSDIVPIGIFIALISIVYFIVKGLGSNRARASVG